MTTINERIASLRESMKKQGISAYIVPGTDPHASEYIADCWKERVWISGFTGSAGTAVVALEKAGLWTDSRYFIQASDQLKGSGIDLMKQGLPDSIEIVPWLSKELKAGEKVGINPQMISLNAYNQMKTNLALSNIELVSIDLIDVIWNERPAIPVNSLFVFDEKFSGKSTKDKLDDLRTKLAAEHADVFILSALDDIAWLFNIRGNDVKYNPVVVAYALVDAEKAYLFLENGKISDENKKILNNQGVEILPYSEIYKNISAINPQKAVLVDGAKLNQSLYEAIPTGCTIRNTMSPVFRLKSIKNETEMNGVRRAMVKDGVALTRFFMWLEQNVQTGKITEIEVSQKLYECRKEQDSFVGESFGTIAGYAGHGAIVHYEATPDTNATLKSESLLLLDSGGQYLDGTTDITRTVALGAPSIQQKQDFTLVLKGHIAIATAIFPEGTRGSQLDILARKAMWDRNINYGHGTGHGVGHFLNVHEGPQNIRMDENPTTLQPGMFMSNEPGVYRTNQYGIRIENLIHVIPAKESKFGKFLQFETITMFPIDKNLVDLELMTKDEMEWLNNYHLKVYDTISPKLNEEEREWLSKKCAPIKY
jgi:Xaa-Pro aminopeptidase